MGFTLWLLIFAAIFLVAIGAAEIFLIVRKRYSYAIGLAVVTVISAVILYIGFASFIPCM